MSAQPAVPSEPRNNSPDLAERCNQLAAENERLSAQLAEMRAENRSLKKSLGHMLFEEIDIDDDELLDLVGTQPPFETLIAELEAMKE